MVAHPHDCRGWSTCLNIWVSLFSIVLVAQGWLVASNLFDPREAKRLYPLLGMGMVLGAAFGGEFTSRTALLVGTRNLLLASAVMVHLGVPLFPSGRVEAARSAVCRRARRRHEGDGFLLRHHVQRHRPRPPLCR